MVNHTSSLTVTIILMEESLSLFDTNVPMVTSQDPSRGARSLHRAGRRRRDKESQGASTRTRAAHPCVVFLNVHALTSVLHIWSYVYIYIYMCLYITWSTYNTHIIYIYIYICTMRVCVLCTFSLSSKSRTPHEWTPRRSGHRGRASGCLDPSRDQEHVMSSAMVELLGLQREKWWLNGNIHGNMSLVNIPGF